MKAAARFWGRFEALPRRTRWLLAVALLAVVAMSWESLVAAPRRAEAARLAQARDEAQAAVAALRAHLAAERARRSADPNASLRARIAELQKELAAVDKRIEDIAAAFVRPQQMPRVLQDLIGTDGRIRLVRLRNLEPALFWPAKAKPAEGEEVPVRLYRHGLELELEGAYLDILAYLQRAEALPWRLHWDALELATKRRGRVRVRVRVSTLGLEPQWIGV